MTEVSVRQKIRFLFDLSRNPDRFAFGHLPRGSHRVHSGLIPQRPALSSLKSVAARCLYAKKLSCLSCVLACICNTSASISEYLSRSIVQIRSRFRSSRRMISSRRKSPAEYLGEPEGLPPAGQSTPAGGAWAFGAGRKAWLARTVTRGGPAQPGAAGTRPGGTAGDPIDPATGRLPGAASQRRGPACEARAQLDRAGARNEKGPAQCRALEDVVHRVRSRETIPAPGIWIRSRAGRGYGSGRRRPRSWCGRGHRR